MDRNDISLDSVDIQRMQEVSSRITKITTTNILREMLPEGIAENILQSLSKYLKFTHEALLVFSSEDGVKSTLKKLGYSVEDSLPSTIVKLRIADRYYLRREIINIRWLHGTTVGKDGLPKQMEIFFLPKETPGLTDEMIKNERTKELEAHLAFEITDPDVVIIRGLKSTLIAEGGFTEDGGGVNLDENPEAGGTTVLYFAKVVNGRDGQKQLVRLELICPGNYFVIADENQSTSRLSIYSE